MIEFFLRRKILTNLVSIFLISVGLYQFFTMRREAFPDIRFEIVTVTTVFPGASPSEVETQLTIPIEKEIRRVSGIDKVMSYSLEDRSFIVLRLNEDLSDREIDKVINNIQQAVTRVEDFPSEAKQSIVEEMTSDRPLITVSVAGGSENDRLILSEEIQDDIETIDGVSKVDLDGKNEREIWVEASVEKLLHHQISLSEIAGALKAKSTKISAGSVETKEQEIWVRVDGELKNSKDVSKTILRSNDSSNFLRVEDVAQVSDRFEEPRTLTKANGKPAIHLMVRKKKIGDTIVLSDQVRQLVKKWQQKADEKNISLIISDDNSFWIKRRLAVMKNNMIQGGLLVTVALFLFLDWRLALVAALGVPTSFAMAFVLGSPMGLTINLISLLGFIIVLGMLDDDSVVVAENIYRHLEMGKKPMQAAIDGSKEVLLPVLGSVATSSCAFLPFALMTGIMGKFLISIPIIVLLCFVASALEAFFILPAHVVDLMPFGRPVEEKKDSRWYKIVENFYAKTIGWALSRRYKFMMLLAGFMLITFLLAKNLGFVLFPGGTIDQFFVEIRTQEGSGLNKTEQIFKQIEAELAKLPEQEVEAIITTIGINGFEETLARATNLAQARVFLIPQDQRKTSTKQTIELLREKLKNVPGVTKLSFEEMKAGPPVGKAVQLRISGRDLDTISRLGHFVKEQLAQIKGVVDIRDSTEGGKIQLTVSPLDQQAAFAGLNTPNIAQNIFYALGGIEAAKIRLPTEEIKVRVKIKRQELQDQQAIQKLLAFNAYAKPVELKQVVQLKQNVSAPYLERYNYRPSITILADVKEGVITSRQANQRLAPVIESLQKQNPGYRFTVGGEEEETEKSLQSLFRAFSVTMMLDYVILATLFGSYFYPLIILLTVPIGILGVVYALIVHGQPISFMSLLGVVAMTGVVVNNAIVMVDFIIRERENGKSALDAARDASITRLRPIWASALTTLLGLFPTAYGFGGDEPFIRPMALAMAWGLMFAMPLTLFLIPSAYLILDDCKSWIKKIFKSKNQ